MWRPLPIWLWDPTLSMNSSQNMPLTVIYKARDSLRMGTNTGQTAAVNRYVKCQTDIVMIVGKDLSGVD